MCAPEEERGVSAVIIGGSAKVLRRCRRSRRRAESLPLQLATVGGPSTEMALGGSCLLPPTPRSGGGAGGAVSAANGCPLKVSRYGGSCQGRPRPRWRRARRRDRTLRGLLWRLFCTIGLWPRRQAELTTHKGADKRKVDAGLVTLKRSVALVPACHSRIPVASGSYLLL